LGLIDHLIVGIEAARAITGEQRVEEMARALSSERTAACVVTAGAKGCGYSLYGGAVEHFPAYAVKVVDTTGCGDVFHGAYTAALARGEDVSRAIQTAAASAAMKATCCGGREGIPNLEQVERFIAERAQSSREPGGQTGGSGRGAEKRPEEEEETQWLK
jgi:sugar/nucleoside kinase (ribokinase family)